MRTLLTHIAASSLLDQAVLQVAPGIASARLTFWITVVAVQAVLILPRLLAVAQRVTNPWDTAELKYSFARVQDAD